MQAKTRPVSIDSYPGTYETSAGRGPPISETRRTVLAWLMTYTANEEPRIRQMMEMVGVPVALPHRAVVVSLKDPVEPPAPPQVLPTNSAVGCDDAPMPAVEYMLDHIAACWGTDFFCRTGDKVYAFWTIGRRRFDGEANDIAGIARSNWARLGAPGRLLVGIGSPASDGMSLKRSLDEAETCITLLAHGAFHEADSLGVLQAEQIHVYQLLRLIREEGALRAFVDRWVGPLIEHDEARGTDLVHTLEVYLDCGGSLREAASRLYLHPRGVRYRLDRLLDLLGVDCPTPDWKLAVHMAVKALRLLGDHRAPPERMARFSKSNAGRGAPHRA